MVGKVSLPEQRGLGMMNRRGSRLDDEDKRSESRKVQEQRRRRGARQGGGDRLWPFAMGVAEPPGALLRWVWLWGAWEGPCGLRLVRTLA